MKKSQMMLFAAGLMVIVSTQYAFAEETAGEKISTKAHDVKRSIKKGAHRTTEALCMKGDFDCGVDKVKNRTLEAKDSTVDKTREIKKKMN